MKNNSHHESSLDEFLEEERKKDKRDKIQLTIGIVFVCLLTVFFTFQTCNQTANANTIYTWQTIDNTKSFTDNLKWIPEKYKENSEKIKINGLKDYFKYTPVLNEKEHKEKLMKRLKELRNK